MVFVRSNGAGKGDMHPLRFHCLSARTCPAPAGLHGEAVPSRPGAGLAALTRGEPAGSELKCGLRVFSWGMQAPPELFQAVSRMPGGVG